MNSFFNDLKNRDVIKVIASFLDFVSLGNFLKSSSVINHSCKLSLSHREPSSDDISKALEASYMYPRDYIKFYDTRIINASWFFRPMEVIIYDDEFHNRMREHYFVIGDKKQGHIKWYWWNGNLGWKCFCKDDQFDGVYKEYYRTGDLRSERSYKDGKNVGPYKEYWSNGNIKEEGFYKDDKKDGPYKRYWNNGNIKKEGFYKDDKKDGPYKRYWNNGNIKKEGFYKDGHKDDSYKSYFSNGTVNKNRFYENGKRVSL